MFKWLRKLTGLESGKSNPEPNTKTTQSTQRQSINAGPSPAPLDTRPAHRTIQPRQQMSRASQPQRRNDTGTTSSSTSSDPVIVHQPYFDGSPPAESPAPAFKSGGGGEFGGGGATGGWGGGDCGGGGGDGGGGCGGGECHSDFSRDVIAIKMNRRARHRAIFPQ